MPMYIPYDASRRSEFKYAGIFSRSCKLAKIQAIENGKTTGGSMLFFWGKKFDFLNVN